MIKIFGTMLMDIIVFIFLYIVLFMIFAGPGQLLFAEISYYRNLGESIKTLIAVSTGQLDYTFYDPLKDVDPWVGYIFSIVFMILTNVMLFNFLIAILSTTYSQLIEVKNGLYLRRVIVLRQYYNYDKYYSSIVFIPPPFNIFSMLTMFIVCLCRSPKLNMLINVTWYTVIGICAILGFIVCSLLLWPFSYLVIMIAKFKHIPAPPISKKIDVLLRVLDLIAFMFVGLFLIFFWIILDIINFSCMLYSSNIMSIDRSTIEKARINFKYPY